MTRSLILIAAIAVTSFLTQSAVGQFNLPKIKIPKIPKTDAPANPSTPNNPDPVTSNSDSSSTSKGGDSVRGVPISGAKIIFSNNPDGSNPKTSFTSSENI